ncbi:hypothetical protein EON63_25110 [archaeon]|nr:MAG: hypothetical protein EON63_25110 [archaeon]
MYTKLSIEAANVIKLHGVDLNPHTGVVQNNRGGVGGGKTSSVAPSYFPPSEYVSEKWDGVTRVGEMMGMTNRLGRDEVGGWVGWALANCYMVSMGYLGKDIVCRVFTCSIFLYGLLLLVYVYMSNLVSHCT